MMSTSTSLTPAKLSPDEAALKSSPEVYLMTSNERHVSEDNDGKGFEGDEEGGGGGEELGGGGVMMAISC